MKIELDEAICVFRRRCNLCVADGIFDTGSGAALGHLAGWSPLGHRRPIISLSDATDFLFWDARICPSFLEIF